MNRQAGAYLSLAFAAVSALFAAHAQAETDPCETASGAVPMIPECSHLISDTWIMDYLVYSFNNRGVPTMDEVCGDQSNEYLVYLNYTIHNGELKGICYGAAYHFANLSFEIEATDEGHLILDIPHDLFTPKHYDGYDDTFTAHVYSTKYTIWEDRHYVERKYVPAFFEEQELANMTDDECLDLRDKTCEEIFEGHRRYWMGLHPPEIQHLLITKVGSFETFDRYKFPFLKDDYFFDLELNGIPYMVSAFTYEHSPQKYANPDSAVVSIVTSDADMQEIPSPRKQIDGGVPVDQVQCDMGKTLLVRHDTQKTICVYESSVERLLERGFAII